MIAIDKLCYNSRLRYENAGEKSAFAVITLCICVMSRSIAVAGIVLAVTGILTVKKGGVPVFRYLKFLTIPLAFLLLSTLAILFHIKREPLDLFAIPLGGWYLTAGTDSFFTRCSWFLPPSPPSPACIFCPLPRPCRIFWRYSRSFTARPFSWS